MNKTILAILQLLLILVMVVLSGTILKYGKDLSKGACRMCEEMHPGIECINPKTYNGGILWPQLESETQNGEWLIEPTK